MMHKIYSLDSLGLALRTERKKKNFSQQEVGDLIDIEQHTISKVENGNPGTSLNTLFRILAALDLEIVIQPRQKANENTEGDNW